MTKNMIALAIAFAFIVAGILTFTLFSGSKGGEYSKDFEAMDTECTITLYKKKHAKEYINEIERLDKALDRYNKESSVYAFNTTGSAELDDDALLLFEKSKELYSKYGKVNITYGGLISLWGITSDAPKVPTETEISFEIMKSGFDKISRNDKNLTTKTGTALDFGAVAKGYALDRLKQKLSANGEGYAVISLGSSTLLYGQKKDKTPFKVAVKDPKAPGSILLTFETDEGFVSTSGGYERYFEQGGIRYIHIFDLTKGCPVQSDLASVTVIAASGAESDFLSTAILIGGSAGLKDHLSSEDYQVIAITQGGEILYSPALEGKIKVNK